MAINPGRAHIYSKTICRAVFLLFSALLLFACSNHQGRSSNQLLEKLDVDKLKMAILADISGIVTNDDELPATLKSDINRFAISPLGASSEVDISGDDAITRPIAVTFQNAFEQTLMRMIADNKVSKAIAIIHTRKPTTPLCNPYGEALKQTMAKAMQDDPQRIKTIEDRTLTLREMARTGPPLSLHIAYIKGGLEQRSAEEQSIYKREINESANSSLHDEELSCTEMPDNIVGASYILKTRMGHTLYFANNGIQAKDTSGKTHWRYWFGNLKDADVSKRYHDVMNYLKKCQLNLKL